MVLKMAYSFALTFNIWIQIILDFLQDEHDFILRRLRIVCDFTGQIRGSSNRLPLPWQEENHASITRRWIQQPHLLRTIITCNKPPLSPKRASRTTKTIHLEAQCARHCWGSKFLAHWSYPSCGSCL